MVLAFCGQSLCFRRGVKKNLFYMQEVLNCQNCRQYFVIEEEDFAFYERIKVPPPTYCPICRLRRRLVFRNESILYKRKCDAPGHSEMLISLFDEASPIKVYDQKYWWSDAWDAAEYGREYDFSRTFFEQFKELTREVPQSNLMGNYASLVRSEYTNWAGDLKDCYLIFDADIVENSAYGSGVMKSKDFLDCDAISNSELCYDCYNINQCYKTVGSVNCHECQDVYFSKGCVGCSQCFGCMNLRKRSYCLFNIQYSKEDYAIKLREYYDGTYSAYVRSKSLAKEHYLKFPHKSMRGLQNNDVSGDYIYNSRNVKHSFLVRDAENGKFLSIIHSPGTKDCYDYTDWGENAELIYDSITVGMGASRVKFSHMVFKNVHDIEYGYYCINSSYLFGCVGLRNKQYCILNKQYTKEEFEKMRTEIIKQMNEKPYLDANGRVYRYGEFFPPEVTPFAYNETIAQEYIPLTKEEAIRFGFNWREREKRSYSVMIKTEQLPEYSSDAGDEVLSSIIECEHKGECAHECASAFKLIPQEFVFYKKMNLPLPRLCSRCRHYERLTERNAPVFYKRRCECAGLEARSENHNLATSYKNITRHTHGERPCTNEFETTYSPESRELVYCESCYQSEVS